MSAVVTPDRERALQALRDDGLVVLTGVLSAAATREVRARLEAAADASEADGVPTRGYAFDTDTRNRRVFHLFNLDPVFVDLIQRPDALQFVRQTLGESFLISNFSANITAPGSGRMALHADQGYVLPPWPDQPLACNVAWVLDDFTEENGGTRYVPGSHRRGRGPAPDEQVATVPVLAPAGSLLVMDGRLWHQTGDNRSRDQHRAALFGYYVMRWLRPQINWNAVLWPDTVATLSPAFLDLLGYYSGNVEAQVPNGRRAPVQPPASLGADRDRAFALGPGAARAG
jgi:ectoine hydroxylase-related dioxygenase (phytanoyl-CoA dioxygenase family)